MSVFPGLGTVINALAVIAGGLVGMAVGERLPARTRRLVTDCLGLVTMLMAALSAASVTSTDLTSAVPTGTPILIVLGSLLIGGIIGSLLRLEDRLEALGSAVVQRASRRRGAAGAGTVAGATEATGADAAGAPAVSAGTDAGGGARAGAAPATEMDAAARFTQGWLTATLLFCVGPLTILGSLDDGLGRGIDKLALKSTLDGFASIGFAASFGPGVLASAVSILISQGALTLVGALLGSVLTAAQIAALTATGGLMLSGISLRLLNMKDVPVGDLVPALVVAPLLTSLISR